MSECVVCKENKATFTTHLSVAEEGVRISGWVPLCPECQMVTDKLVEAVRTAEGRAIWYYSFPAVASGLSFTNPVLPARVMEDPFPEWERLQTQARQSGYSGEACDKCGMFTMKRTGTCMTCEACGETSGGCS